MKNRFFYSTISCILMCLLAQQTWAQVTTTTFTTDATWAARSTPGRNLAPLTFAQASAGPWGTAQTSATLPDACLTNPLVYPGTPIFSPGNVACNDGGASSVFTSFFRRTFTLQGGSNPLCTGTVRVRADNLFRVYVDGTLVPGTNTTACGGWNYTNLSGWNWNQIYDVNIMPFINLALTTHTILFEVGNCDYVNYLAARVTITQGLPYYSPDFTVAANCNSGWSVTATPVQPTASTHIWELYQTNVPGATSGGTLVATQTGPTANFQWLDLSKFYYIIHRIPVGCNQTVEAVREVPHINNATLNYQFEDVNGVAKDQFCMGEDVYLDPAGTTNYDRYLMILRKRPLGSSGPFGNDFNYGYTFTTNIGLLNLTDLFETAGYVFTPNTEYELQFVIQNIPNCIAWIELKKTFSIICCSTTPDFTVTINCDNGWGVTATPNSNVPTNHVWQLFETTVPGATTGGTQVGSNQFGTTVNYQWLDQSKSYYITHTISMPGCYGPLTTSVAVPTFASQASLQYNFKDQDGNVKNEFCIGEDVYLDPSGTSNYDRYYMAIGRRAIGSPGPFGNYVAYGFTFTNNIGLLNLTQLFQSVGVTFSPGFEYELQFAIQNPPRCIPWIELRKTFTVVCCDGFIAPNFYMTLSENSSGIAISVDDFKPYGVNETHTWTVLSSPNPNGGPYSFVTQTTTTGAGPHVIYNGGVSGQFYFVVHKVSTLCGDYCYVKRGEIFGFQETSPDESSTPCEICGVIDCDFLDEICLVPNNLRIACNPIVGLIATWDAVPGATQYQLQVTFNDPSCCNKPASPWVYTYTTSNTVQLMGNLQNHCFSYRIAAICDGGEPQWSEPNCFTGCIDTGGIGLAENTNDEDTPAPALGQVLVYPNPANNEINIVLPAETKAEMIRMVDLSGKVVFEQRNPEEKATINSSSFLAGMYAIQIIYQDGSIIVENIVVTH